jgi:metal-sulfur cluster biosynthetic enzyme
MGKINQPSKLTKKAVINQLKTVIDPELGFSIVDLGLVYGVDIEEAEDGQGQVVEITMTLTSPGCPLAPVIHQLVEEAVMRLPGVEDYRLQIVWEPPWDISKATEEVRLVFGM